MDRASPLPVVDTTSFKPMAMRPTERAAVLRKLLITYRSTHVPSSRVGVYEESDLSALWTGALYLRPVIVTVLGHRRYERLRLLFDAVDTARHALAPDARPALVVCSSPNTSSDGNDSLRSLAAKSGIDDTVFLLGEVPATELPSLFAAADAYLSTARRTTAHLWQAMACATPSVVLTDADTEQVIVHGGYEANGWVTDPNTDDLAAALVQVCRDPAERFRRGTAAAARLRAHEADSASPTRRAAPLPQTEQHPPVQQPFTPSAPCAHPSPGRAGRQWTVRAQAETTKPHTLPPDDPAARNLEHHR
ncbi:glycosyltransferase [Kitasatospora sp. NPDC092039]|uniref:glycosyltransferase n=1 Tax=Kitasatospora sp. NPDC092039 TaxID=3364086 RepID=UPI0038250444